MLDVSQYTGSRKRHNFELVNFWQAEASEALRRVKLIYEPEWNQLVVVFLAEIVALTILLDPLSRAPSPH